MNEASFPIRYIYQKNGGKHRALNTGIKTITSPMAFIVDSDDWLTQNAVETIEEYGKKYEKRENICGLSFLRKFPDGTINGSKFPRDQMIGSYLDVRINSGDTNSDKAEAFYTTCLKEFPFKEFKNEKFLGEDTVWLQMGRKYQTVYINEAIYIGEYRTDGLTRNRRANNIKSPSGCMYRASLYLADDVNAKFREKCALQYLIYGWFAKKSTRSLIQSSNKPVLVAVNILPARLIYQKWKKEFASQNRKG